MVLRNSSSHHTALVITDVSIKNDIATSILHIYIANHPLTTTVHYVVFVTSMDAELFALEQAWLIPHLIANNSASVLVTNTA